MNKEKGIIAVVILVLIIFFFLFSFRVIKAGTVGVIMRFGKITGEPLSAGGHFVIPFVDRISVYNVQKITYETADKIEQSTSKANYKDYPVDTTTKDGQRVIIEYTIRFSIDPVKVGWIAKNVGSEKALVEKIVKTESRIWARNIPREYKAEELYTGNVQEVSLRIEEVLRPKFEENGLYLDTFGIRDIDFASEYVQVIEQKQIEAEKIKIEEHKATQATFRKQAQITEAEAMAEAQRLQRETLSTQMLEKISLDVDLLKAEALLESAKKGVKIVPDTIIGGDVSMLYQLP